MNRQFRSTPLRWIAVLVALDMLATGLAAQIHLALSPHRFCSVHGRFEQEEDPGDHRHAPDDRSPDDHHSCPFMAFVQCPVEVDPGTVALVPPVDAPLAIPVALTADPYPGEPSFRLAPKASPPPLSV